MATQAELIELAGLIQVAHDRALQLAALPTTAEKLATNVVQLEQKDKKPRKHKFTKTSDGWEAVSMSE